MKIAIDVSPIEKKGLIQHRVRGVGFYINNLKRSLVKYFPKNKYTFFVRGENLSKDTDLIHYPYFEPFFITLPLFNRCKTIVTVHDLTPLVFPKYFPKGVRGGFKWLIQKASLRKANLIIADSLSSKRDIIKFTGVSEKKIEVIYLAAGEEFKRFKTDDLRLKKIREKYNLPEKFALYVGDVTWNKNLPRLVEAARKSRIPLVMVGKTLVSSDFDKNNPWNQDLLEVQKLVEGNKNILRVGFVETEDLVVLYNLATVFIMPSLYEGFGLPILEAMACGCPVITTKEGSIPEVAGDAAFYTDAYDSDKIAKDITEVFEDEKLRKEFSAAGFKQSGKFSWKKTAEQTVRAYEKVLEKG
ncbi:MAG: glycosyltransferase family 1 protein [Patescibacteria group bacterium]